MLLKIMKERKKNGLPDLVSPKIMISVLSFFKLSNILLRSFW